MLIYFNYLSLLVAIYVAGIQGALAMEPLLSNAQIGDAVQNNTHTLIAGRTPSYALLICQQLIILHFLAHSGLQNTVTAHFF